MSLKTFVFNLLLILFIPIIITQTTYAADPFSALSSDAQVLKHYSANELVMVGTISHGTDLFGIIKTPDDQVYTVKPGSEIGNNGYVLDITSKQITVSENSEITALALQQVD